MYLSDAEKPVVGLEVKSFWSTPGRVSSVRDMRGEDLNRWAIHHHHELLIRIEWSHGASDEAPQSHMKWVRVLN